MSFSSVAENTLIGIVTIPKEMAPFQIACIAISSLSHQWGHINGVRSMIRSKGRGSASGRRGARRGQQVGDLLCREPQQLLSLARVEGENSVFGTLLRPVPAGRRRPDHPPGLAG